MSEVTQLACIGRCLTAHTVWVLVTKFKCGILNVIQFFALYLFRKYIYIYFFFSYFFPFFCLYHPIQKPDVPGHQDWKIASFKKHRSIKEHNLLPLSVVFRPPAYLTSLEKVGAQNPCSGCINCHHSFSASGFSLGLCIF